MVTLHGNQQQSESDPFISSYSVLQIMSCCVVLCQGSHEYMLDMHVTDMGFPERFMLQAIFWLLFCLHALMLIGKPLQQFAVAGLPGLLVQHTDPALS